MHRPSSHNRLASNQEILTASAGELGQVVGQHYPTSAVREARKMCKPLRPGERPRDTCWAFVTG
jgi:hypothetical protein